MFVGSWVGRIRSGMRTALAVSVLLTGTALPVWADDASTNSNSGGGAAAGGPGTSGAGVGTENSSNASSDKNGVSGSSQGTSDSGGFNTGGTVSKTHTHAKAWARGNKKGLEAGAEAGAWTTATAVDKNGLATGLSGNSGKAYAKSSKKETLAYATSSNGGYALAVSGRGRSTTTSYVPDGQTIRSGKAKLQYSISYTDLGSFSMAVVKGRAAYAVTGTTENVGALTSGNISAIMRSSMFAEAYADRFTAWARASAEGGSTASTASSFASSYGYSYAFAQVTLRGKTTVKFAAPKCDSSDERRDRPWENCKLKHKKYVNVSFKRASKAKFKTLH